VRDLDEAAPSRGDGPFTLLATGMGLALASPSAILWFAAVGGSVIASFGAERHALLGFAAGFFAAGILWSAVLAFSAAGLRRILGAHLLRGLSLLAALLFVYFAVVVFERGLAQMGHYLQ
jgi:L-lysine exporter family protein LysE/ArgO